MASAADVLSKLTEKANSDNLAGMAKFGIAEWVMLKPTTPAPAASARPESWPEAPASTQRVPASFFERKGLFREIPFIRRTCARCLGAGAQWLRREPLRVRGDAAAVAVT
jgi:hypothetical protein